MTKIYTAKEIKKLIRDAKNSSGNGLDETIEIHGKEFLGTDFQAIRNMEKKENIYFFSVTTGKDMLKFHGYETVGEKINIGMTKEVAIKGFDNNCVNIFARNGLGFLLNRIENSEKGYMDKSQINTLSWMLQKEIYHN